MLPQQHSTALAVGDIPWPTSRMQSSSAPFDRDDPGRDFEVETYSHPR